MKKRTLFLGLVFLMLLAFAAVFWLGGTLSARPRIMTAGAAEYPEIFESIRGVLATGSAPQVFDGAPLGDAEQYTLVDVTIDLVNRGFFPAEWLDIRAEGIAGDVAVYALTGEGGGVDARGASQVNLKLLTAAPPDAGRSYVIQYYVYGVKRTVTVR